MVGTGRPATTAVRVAVLIVCCGVVAAQGLWLRNPGKNWDRLAYYALALRAQGHDAREARDLAYDEVRRSASADEYAELTGVTGDPSGYRRFVAQHPDSFDQQLGFYRPRGVYIALLAAADKAGVPLPVAGMLLSLVPALILTAAGTLWLTERPTRASILWAFAFASAVVLSRMAGIQGPDAAAALLGFCGSVLFLRGRAAWGVALVLAAVTFRPDYAVFAVCLSFAGIWRGRSLPAVCLGPLAVAAFMAMPALWPDYGFAVQAHHTFGGWQYYPEVSPGGWSISDHVRAIAHNIVPFLKNDWHVVLVVLFLIARRRHVDRSAAAAVLVFLLLRFVSFPIVEARQYALVACLGVYLLGAGSTKNVNTDTYMGK